MHSSWWPLENILVLSNLPANICPTHLTRILSHPPHPGGLLGKRNDPGISLLQVYTIPRKPSRRCRLFNRIRLKRRIDPSFQNAPRTSVDKPATAHFPSRDRVEEVEGEDNQSISEGEEKVDPSITIAYIHFRTDEDLTRAFNVLKRVTIDGHVVKVEERYWNSGPVRRLLKRR